MQLITSYAPPTFLKPCVVFSTLAHETAICFVESLNGNSALSHLFGGGEDGTKKTGWIVLKAHKTPREALAFHTQIARTYRNGESQKIWEKGYDPYLELFRAHKEAILKAGIRG